MSGLAFKPLLTGKKDEEKERKGKKRNKENMAIDKNSDERGT